MAVQLAACGSHVAHDRLAIDVAHPAIVPLIALTAAGVCRFFPPPLASASCACPRGGATACSAGAQDASAVQLGSFCLGR